MIAMLSSVVEVGGKCHEEANNTSKSPARRSRIRSLYTRNPPYRPLLQSSRYRTKSEFSGSQHDPQLRSQWLLVDVSTRPTHGHSGESGVTQVGDSVGARNATRVIHAVIPLPFASACRAPVMMRWGLVPSWAKGPKIGSRLINARCMTVAEKPSFRDAFKLRRCLAAPMSSAVLHVRPDRPDLTAHRSEETPML